MLFIQYPPCSTCQKAKKWLDAKGIAYTDRHIKEQNPSYEELKEWYEKSGLPLKKFFNTSGLLYKSLNLKEKLPQMTDEEQLRVVRIHETMHAYDCNFIDKVSLETYNSMTKSLDRIEARIKGE